ncbi:class I SAM-dependent methyltransferase [Phyllobacterium chamaecytisi]|uniref:class I SAM-dependent methyltransferase n=1 Tax=Phyllobacterium chamaecytisi TaxID=2876082 RepID=UPI001CCD5135|nr:class I SAM-dependent methyltransferase [Phyllobacterium sp. KW56]MBZ9603879.1 class I SAM-dependent methyltransferase [Phyllobacterium sp. KW56]
MQETIDQQYYEVARPGTAAGRIMMRARENMYDEFAALVRPIETESILDVGVSDIQTDGANWFEARYPHKSTIHACGLGQGRELKQAYPEITYTQISANKALPFADDQFDIATANAVLEHVGNQENQQFFVSELIRVSRRVFITVPHRYFPVEHHTGFPFVHYTNWSFSVSCSIFGKEDWSKEENLILMSASRLRLLSPPGSKVGYTGIRLGCFSSNLFLYYEK